MGAVGRSRPWEGGVSSPQKAHLLSGPASEPSSETLIILVALVPPLQVPLFIEVMHSG